MVEESSAAPPSISVDAEQVKPEDAVLEYHSPATFYPPPSTKPSLLEYKSATDNRGSFWSLEQDDGLYETASHLKRKAPLAGAVPIAKIQRTISPYRHQVGGDTYEYRHGYSYRTLERSGPARDTTKYCRESTHTAVNKPPGLMSQSSTAVRPTPYPSQHPILSGQPFPTGLGCITPAAAMNPAPSSTFPSTVTDPKPLLKPRHQSIYEDFLRKPQPTALTADTYPTTTPHNSPPTSQISGSGYHQPPSTGLISTENRGESEGKRADTCVSNVIKCNFWMFWLTNRSA